MVALKFDNEKPDYSLLSRAMLEPVIRAFMYGANKYGRHNFKSGFVNTRLLSAAQRHIMAWQSGEELDPESGESHLSHAVAALFMLMDNIDNGVSTEGRYLKDAAGE